jgi:hypothetical protein
LTAEATLEGQALTVTRDEKGGYAVLLLGSSESLYLSNAQRVVRLTGHLKITLRTRVSEFLVHQGAKVGFIIQATQWVVVPSETWGYERRLVRLDADGRVLWRLATPEEVKIETLLSLKGPSFLVIGGERAVHVARLDS